MPDHGADENPHGEPEAGHEPEQRRDRAPENTGETENTVSGGVHDDAQVIQADKVNVYEHSYGGDHHEFHGATFVDTQYVHHHAPHQVDWPIRVGALPDPALHFRPREMTGELERALGQSETVVLRQVLSGTGGVGKTQLAAHYARTLAQITAPEERVDVLLWTDASSRERITTAYAQAARFLFPEVPKDPEQASGLFLTWLGDPNKNEGRRWLVVWDNLADPAEVNNLWPPSDQPNGRVLVTTRRRDHTLSVQGRELIDVDVYSPEEARVFLTQALNEAGIPYTEQHLQDLAEALGYLPLALNQAVTYMAELRLGCPAYLELFHDRMMSLDDVFPDWESRAESRTTPLATTWELSLEQADSYRPKGVARPLLGLIALLDGSGIPEEVLTADPVVRRVDPSPPVPPAKKGLWRRLSSTVRGRSGSERTRPEPSIGPHQVRVALANLERLSLISHISREENSRHDSDDSKVGASVVRCHQLVQRATREHHLTRPSYENVHAVADALLDSWPDIERDTTLGQQLRDNSQALRSHLTSNGQSSEHWLWEPDAHTLLFRAGKSLGEAGRAIEAVRFWSELHSASSQILGPHHPDTLIARSDLASWHGESGHPRQAVHHLDEVLTDRVRLLGKDHPETLSTRHGLAYWQGQAGNLHQAIHLTNEVLTDRVRLLGKDHPETLGARHNLAYWQGEAGNLHQAIHLTNELIADQTRILGYHHPITLITRSNLAGYHGDIGEIGQAICEFERLLSDRTRVLGPHHPETLRTRANLADWYSHSEDLHLSLTRHSELLTEYTHTFGDQSPRTLTLRGDIAVLTYDSGETFKGIDLLKCVINDMIRTLGSNHPDTNGAERVLLGWLKEQNIQKSGGDSESNSTKVDDLLPTSAQTQARVLVTTYHRDHAPSVQGREFIDADIYSPEEARAFLAHVLDEAGTPHSDQHIDDLAEALGYLPLAMNQAVTYMAELGLDCPAYLELFHDRVRSLNDVFPGWESPIPLATTWELSLAQADSCEPKGVARPLMGLIALLDGSGIPEDVLTSEAVLEWVDPPSPTPPAKKSPWQKLFYTIRGGAGAQDPLPQAGIGPQHVRAAMANLERLRLIYRVRRGDGQQGPDGPNPDPSVVRCHRLVQRATREHHLTLPSYEAVQFTADALADAWPDIERGTTLAQQLRHNTQVLRSHSIHDGRTSEHWLWEPDAHELLFRAGESLGDADLVGDAIRYWSEMHALADQFLEPHHPDTLTIRNSLAGSLGAAGRHDKAITLLEEVLTDRTRSLGKDHPDTLTTRGNIAAWTHESGETNRSVELLADLLRDERRVLGSDHPEVQLSERLLEEWISERDAQDSDEDPEGN